MSSCYLLLVLVGIIIFCHHQYDIHPKNVSFFTIFLQNIRLALCLIVFGNLSFGLLSFLLIIFNSIFLGNVLICVFNRYGINPIITGILPHAFLEILALLMAASIGLETQKFIYNIRYIDKKCIRIRYSLYFLIMLVFLLIFAALIESHLKIVL